MRDEAAIGEIAVLGNQVADVTGEHEIIYGALDSTAQPDHFRDTSKMVDRDFAVKIVSRSEDGLHIS